MIKVILTLFNPLVSLLHPISPERGRHNKIERSIFCLGVEITLLGGLTIQSEKGNLGGWWWWRKIGKSLSLPLLPLCKIDHQISSINISVQAPFPYIHTASNKYRMEEIYTHFTLGSFYMQLPNSQSCILMDTLDSEIDLFICYTKTQIFSKCNLVTLRKILAGWFCNFFQLTLRKN